MKTILAITHLAQDLQLELVGRISNLCNIRIVPICTNTISFEKVALVQVGSQIKLFIDGENIQPDGLWFATYPREDTLFNSKMSKYEYPGEYRSSVQQFILDLRFSFEKIKFLPGKFENILRADSKLSLFATAKKLGIAVPSFTMNCNLQTKRTLSKKMLYRKKLGFPAVVSYSKSTCVEEVITTLNGMTTKDSACLLWQWQKPIESISHVRGVIVGNKSWFVKWNRRSTIKSLVDFRNMENDEDQWQKFDIPEIISKKIIKLCNKLKIVVCCPEFLITPEGEWILIDLNPCGDWYGFFSSRIRKEIATQIVKIM